MANGCARVMGQMSTCLTNPGSDARMCSFTLCAWAPAEVDFVVAQTTLASKVTRAAASVLRGAHFIALEWNSEVSRAVREEIIRMHQMECASMSTPASGCTRLDIGHIMQHEHPCMWHEIPAACMRL
jgi:hypothetical protein